MLGRKLTTAILATVVCASGSTFSAAAEPLSPDATPTPAPTASAAASRSASDRAPLTPEQVKAQVAEATKLRDQLQKDDAAIAKAGRQLAALAARSNALMGDVSEARAAEEKAKKAERAEIAELTRLTSEVAAARADLSDMAVDAYVHGPGLLREVAAVIDLVATGGSGADAAAKADYLSTARSADRRHYEQLAKAQKAAAAKAAKARAAREAATAKAEKIQKDAAAAVARQQSAVIEMQKISAERRSKLKEMGVADGMIAGVDLSALQQIAVTPLCTEENAVYPNGQWPGSALCALKSAPGHMLRPSAARAYDAMAAAYKKANGTDLCITDSYRSYAAQVDVKRRKPTLAAVPGTSNHGLGLAVDLCGGIDNFGTPQHIWMQQHAPLFGFYHPAWAEPNGSKPEPWHWEFVG